MTTTWLAVLGLALLGGAGAEPVPDDVATWFTHEAAGTVTVLGDGLGVDPAVRIAVGEPRPLHAWSEDFRAGRATTVPVAALGEWIAPYTADGSPAGSVLAWHHDGAVELASVDDGADLATALAGLEAGAAVVTEPVLGAHFALVDGEVTTLVPGFFEGPSTAPVADYQQALADQLDGLAGDVAPEPGPRWWVPVTWGALGTAVAVVVLIAHVRRRDT